MFQSSLRLAMPPCLQINSPELLRSSNVLRLGGLGASRQQNDDGVTILPEVDPVAWPEREPGFPYAGADALVIPEVSELEPENARLDSRSDGAVESPEPLAIWISPFCGQVLANGHDLG